MKKLNRIKGLTILVLLFMCSFTSKGQKGEIVAPDSQYRLVPLPTLQYSNFIGEPIATVGDVIVFKDSRTNPKKVYDINGTPINFAIFGVNTRTGKFILVDQSIQDLGYAVMQSEHAGGNVFFVISYDKTKIYKVIVSQDSISAEMIYQNPSQSITAVTEYLNELVISQSRYGITILRSDNSIRKTILYSTEYSSVTQYGDLIVFGGYSFGIISTLNIETGEIQDIRYNTSTINATFVKTINNQLYADVDGEINKYNGKDSWSKIVSDINPKTLRYNAILGEYTLRTKAGEDYIFRNDSLISIPKSSYENIQYSDDYTHTLYKRYGSAMNFNAWYVLPLNGKLYGVGDGMVGTVQKVAMPGEDTTTGFKKIQLSRLTIYPNPTVDILNISNLEKDTDVSIINKVGEIVLLKKTTGSVDISTLTPGLYFLIIDGYQVVKIQKE